MLTLELFAKKILVPAVEKGLSEGLFRCSDCHEIYTECGCESLLDD